MSMSGTQVAAFNAASGITPQASTVLFVGTVIALSTLWGAWALYSIYRGYLLLDPKLLFPEQPLNNPSLRRVVEGADR